METLPNNTHWIIDPAHSEIHFRVKHLVIATVTGNFETFVGSAVTTGDGWNDAQIIFSADVNSISTKVPDRDTHLKSADFFDAEKFPQLTFKSTSFTNSGGDKFILTGELTIRGTTRQVSLEAEFGGQAVDPWGNTKAGFELSGKINRKDFGLMWNALTEAGGMVVSEEVRLQMNVELLKQS